MSQLQKDQMLRVASIAAAATMLLLAGFYAGWLRGFDAGIEAGGAAAPQIVVPASAGTTTTVLPLQGGWAVETKEDMAPAHLHRCHVRCSKGYPFELWFEGRVYSLPAAAFGWGSDLVEGQVLLLPEGFRQWNSAPVEEQEFLDRNPYSTTMFVGKEKEVDS